jgi:hypothetical protein
MSKQTLHADHSNRFDMACTILQHTHDGDDLEPVELKVVEMAVNDHLNAVGWEKFECIYQERVKPEPDEEDEEEYDEDFEAFMAENGYRASQATLDMLDRAIEAQLNLLEKS